MAKVYGFCTVDGHKEKVGNFNIEPPGLFRGRGDHPKQGMLKRRVMPEDVIINCSKYVLVHNSCVLVRDNSALMCDSYVFVLDINVVS